MENAVGVFEDLGEVVAQVSDPVDQSSENIGVIATVFSSTADLASSENFTVSSEVSGYVNYKSGIE